MGQCNVTNDEHAWIKKVKSEGSVPLLDLNKCSNGWASPPGDTFMVRGSQFFSTKNKIPAGDYLLHPLGFDWIKSSTKLSNLLNNPKHRIWKALGNISGSVPVSGCTDDRGKPFVWAFNLQLPSKDNYSAVAYFVCLERVAKGSLMDQFLKGDDEFRNSRLKLVTNIVKGPWIVKKAAGEQAICIIGRALSCNYCVGENFIEVDIDVGSSMVAKAIVHLAFGYWSTLAVDIAFVIEGRTESELPERVLGAFRFSELNLASAGVPFDDEVESDGNVNRLQASTSVSSTRLWRSISRRECGSSASIGRRECGSNTGAAHCEKTVEDVTGW